MSAHSRRLFGASYVVAVTCIACSGGDAAPSPTLAVGGGSAVGGTVVIGKGGGTSSLVGAGGTQGIGGASNTMVGGQSTGAGGIFVAASGGASAMGGASGNGGTATGGFVAIGGSAIGGKATGGSVSGGGTGIGGTPAGGGSTSGGSATGGNAMGGGATGGGIGGTGSIVVSGTSPSPIRATSYGMNYWSWVVAWGDPVASTQSVITPLKLNVLRMGGTNPDNGTPELFSRSVIEEGIAYARAIGAEPLVQIPILKDDSGGVPTAQTAANLVQYLNVTRGLGVKYFSIGNEPDLYVEQAQKPAGYTASSHCTTFAAFSDAMKAVDSSIQIVGPDLSWMYVSGNDWLTPFLAGCKDKVDIVAVHRYPLDAAATTIAAALGDAELFRQRIVALRALMIAQGVGSKPLAITEANITWNGDPAISTLPASPGTFHAGLWVADGMGVALEEGLWTLAYWSISEGWTLGFLNLSSPRPAYYALKMYADHFGSSMLRVTTKPSGYSVYASRNAADSATHLMVLNRNAAASTETVQLTNFAVPVASQSYAFPAYSLSALVIADSGAVQIWTYTQQQAQSNSGPVQVQ